MDPKTLFVIAVTTSRMLMPGMPAMPKMEGLPAGVKIPGMGEPVRELRMDLTSDKAANAKSAAECAIPAGLQLGPKVKLIIDLPAKEAPGEPGKAEPSGKTEAKKMVIKYYWQCAETVPPGQPKILDTGAMAAGAFHGGNKMNMGKAMRAYKQVADGSHAYWPGGQNPIKDESHCPGTYALTTNYCGGTTFASDPTQDFLAAIELTSPSKKIDLAQTIKVDWQPVPNALAYILTAFGANENEMVIWTSAGDPNVDTSFAYDFMSPTEVKKYIEKGVLLPPDKTSCRIPAGIFKDCSAPMLTVVAIGTDKTGTDAGITTKMTVRSTCTAMLGGGMMGGGDEIDQGDQGEQPVTPQVEEPKDQGSDQSQAQPQPQPQPKKKNPFGKLKDLLNK